VWAIIFRTDQFLGLVGSLTWPTVSNGWFDSPWPHYFVVARIDDEFRHPAAGIDARGEDFITPILEWANEPIPMARQYQSDAMRRDVGVRFSDRLTGIIVSG
jgi:hypothetical protein